jgi:serine/threonine-protein kinase SRPK3
MSELQSTLSRQQFLHSPDLDKVEDVEHYRPNGFHPVALGDVYVERYRILHKLGCGGFSTVWLARDLQRPRNVALKVLSAEASENEVRTLKYLRSTANPHRNICDLEDEFVIDGPNGRHQCLVMPACGPSIKKAPLDTLAEVALRSIIRQIADGLSHLHTSGVCHGGWSYLAVVFGC